MSRVVRGFTRRVPHWRPRVAPVRLEEATEAQIDALRVTPSNTKVSDYVLTLAHDVESLKVRSPLFNAILYDPGGMSRAERELGAIAASMVNRCVYCAAVHADRHAKLEKDTDRHRRALRQGRRCGSRPARPGDLRLRPQAVGGASEPPDPRTWRRLRDAGLTDAEILDLILSSALFGWANRLMHVLGDPVRAEAET